MSFSQPAAHHSTDSTIAYIYIFFFHYYISSSACSITVRNTTRYRSLPFLLVVFIYI